MSAPPSPLYRFGDLLARARQNWLNEMARRIEARGYSDFRRSDALGMRLLVTRSHAIGELVGRIDADEFTLRCGAASDDHRP